MSSSRETRMRINGNPRPGGNITTQTRNPRTWARVRLIGFLSPAQRQVQRVRQKPNSHQVLPPRPIYVRAAQKPQPPAREGEHGGASQHARRSRCQTAHARVLLHKPAEVPEARQMSVRTARPKLIGFISRPLACGCVWREKRCCGRCRQGKPRGSCAPSRK